MEVGDRFTRYLTNWLIIRQAWVRAVNAGRLSYPPSKYWKEILNGLPQFIAAKDHGDPVYASYRQISWLIPPPYDPNAVLSKNTDKCRKAREAALDFLGKSKTEFQTLQRQVPQELHFHSFSCRTEHWRSLHDYEVRCIFWELSELSVRYELLLVDRTLTATLRGNREVADARDEQVMMVFNTTSLASVVHDPLPVVGLGLACPNPYRRRPRLVHLVSLMLSRPGAPMLLSGQVPPEKHSSYLDFEQMCLSFYLQNVYQVFGRRPSVPRVPPIRDVV